MCLGNDCVFGDHMRIWRYYVLYGICVLGDSVCTLDMWVRGICMLGIVSFVWMV